MLDDGTGLLVPPSSQEGDRQPAGCADPTLTGTGFDLAEVALHAVRVAVGTLLQGEPDAYPAIDQAVHVLALRDDVGGLSYRPGPRTRSMSTPRAARSIAAYETRQLPGGRRTRWTRRSQRPGATVPS